MFKVVLKVTQMAQRMIEMIVKPNDVVVDGTLGNGNDTVFLSGLVPEGKVYSFEIQEKAVESFKEVMDKKNIKNVTVINSGHENLESFVLERPAAVMFNLGYLPGGDESIITLPHTTLKALESSTKILKPGGIITIASYSGHPGGQEEQNAVQNWVRALNPKHFSVMEASFTNGKNNSPMLIVIEKNDSCHEGI
jgi:predicted methyltransferase